MPSFSFCFSCSEGVGGFFVAGGTVFLLGGAAGLAGGAAERGCGIGAGMPGPAVGATAAVLPLMKYSRNCLAC